MNARKITFISFLAVCIAITGIFKIPVPFSGASYQLSSPVSVLIAMTFGVGNYLIAGIVASIISLSLGMATLYNVLVAMIFRIVVGIFIWVFGKNKITLVTCSIAGSMAARLVLSFMMGVPFLTLLVPIIPGMIFSSAVSYLFYGKVYALCHRTSAREFMKEKIA